MGRAWPRTLGILLLASCAGACASTSHVRFAPAVQDTDLRGEGGDLQARVVMAWRGVEEGDGILELRFRVRVENPGPPAFALLPAEFELLDGALSSFGFARVPELPALVEAGQAATFELAFPLPAEARLEDFDLSALTLGARLQGGRWNWSTTFERAVPPPEGSPWSFHFGAGWVFH